MLIVLLIFIFTSISLVLFCCVRVSAQCDKMIDDMEQENFIKEYPGH